MKHEKYSSIKHKFKFLATVLSWTVFVLLVLVASLLVYYFIANKIYASKGDNYKPAFGLYTIVSPSMEPNLNIYDVIVNVNVKNPDDIHVNDIITFISTASISKGMTITHRVVSISEDENGKLFQTKGDNNLSPDSVPVPYSNVLGKVVIKIPQLGRLQSFLATRGGWLVVVVVPALLIILNDVLKLFRLTGAQKNMEIAAITTEEEKEQKEQMKKDIEEKLIKRYKPKRDSLEPDPLVAKMKVVKVGDVKEKQENTMTLPKLKDGRHVKRTRYTRKRKG